MKPQEVSAIRFIDEYLIGQIEEIKDKYPYFAFLLMAVGIEFLGKCINEEEEWQTRGKSRADFNRGLSIGPLNKYSGSTPDLYGCLRCGLVHALTPKGELVLSDIDATETLNCDSFYGDFVRACRMVIDREVDIPKKDLDKILFTVTTTEDGASNTGVTTTEVIDKQ